MTSKANDGTAGKANQPLTPESPKCPTCGFVMCQQFDYTRINDIAEYATPNGKFICYHCEHTGTGVKHERR